MKRTIAEILADFEKPIEREYINQKPVFSKKQESGKVDYVAWHTLCRLLNKHTNGYWEWRLRTQFMGDRTVIEGSLTIHGSDGSLTREATGNEESEVDGYGDPSSNAEAMALRRCCAKFGLGLSLWEKGKSTSKGNGFKQLPPASTNGFKQLAAAPSNESKGTLTREEWERKFKKQQQAEFDEETQACLTPSIGDLC
ncbi:hypothetical protein [Microcoleus sp. Pol12A6]|uniref:hypothetical protein n=1 Tax=Microcoleus sp. Pol12A6 TaxID=3055393 RepID=UPI002FD38416